VTRDEYIAYREMVAKLDPDAMERVKTKAPPADETDFALRVSYVILNSGMKWTVAKDIWSRMRPSLIATGEVRTTFGHLGKAKSIDLVMSNRTKFFEGFRLAWEEPCQPSSTRCPFPKSSHCER
jgi:hypothetical protein